MARIDHVIFAVRDPVATAAWLDARYGLAAQAGGRHGDAGTQNRYVPLGRDQYIELLAVSNPDSRHPMVAVISKALTGGDRLLNVALASDDIEAEARRLGEPVFDNETTSEDGRTVRFRLTGVTGILGPEPLPFFVQTISGHQWRGGFEPARHRVAPDGIGRIEYGGVAERVLARIDDPSFPVSTTDGRPGLAAIWFRQGGREVELRA